MLVPILSLYNLPCLGLKCALVGGEPHMQLFLSLANSLKAHESTVTYNDFYPWQIPWRPMNGPWTDILRSWRCWRISSLHSSCPARSTLVILSISWTWGREHSGVTALFSFLMVLGVRCESRCLMVPFLVLSMVDIIVVSRAHWHWHCLEGLRLEMFKKFHIFCSFFQAAGVVVVAALFTFNTIPGAVR